MAKALHNKKDFFYPNGKREKMNVTREFIAHVFLYCNVISYPLITIGGGYVFWIIRVGIKIEKSFFIADVDEVLKKKKMRNVYQVVRSTFSFTAKASLYLINRSNNNAELTRCEIRKK